ncbi:MAG: metal-dependent hydrolase [Bacteroidota bacterium]
MTPLGHLSVSYIASGTLKRISLPAIMIGGLLPDIDFLLFLFPFFDDIHRVITHNVLFVLIVTGTGFMFYSRHPRKIDIVSGLLIGLILHLLCDSIMDDNMDNGIGVAIFWPFSEWFFSPFNIVTPQSGIGWNRPLEQMLTIFQNIVWEVPFWILAGIILSVKKVKYKANNVSP